MKTKIQLKKKDKNLVGPGPKEVLGNIEHIENILSLASTDFIKADPEQHLV